MTTRKLKLEAMIAKEPNDAFLRFGLAMELAKEGAVADAIAQFDQAIRVDPNYSVAFYHKGRILAEQGKLVEAQDVLRQGIVAAQAARDSHSESEIRGLLESLGQ